MLDVETKRRIDTARDILVGKVPDPKSQVEQITIALIYKFMDDMDLESEELGGERSFFKGDFEKYAWHRIFDPRMGGYEIINLYSEAILKMNVNPNIPQLFRDIFKNAYLPYRDPETLKAFLKIINDFTYDHSERLGDAFEYLLAVLGSQGEAGQFRTPRHIIDFMVEIIDPKKDETILDPACGTAGFLISSYKYIIKHSSSNYDPKEETKTFETENVSLDELTINSKWYRGDKLTPDERSWLAANIKGYDISPDMVRLSLVNMYLHGLNDPHINEYDTLTSEDNWNEYADVILANPPFMSPKGGIRPHKRFSISSNRSEVLFVDYIAEHLTPTGRAAVIVPEGIIFQSGNAYRNLRKMLVEEYLVGVISLPAGVFQPYSGVKTSILWLDMSLAKKTDKILFVKIENDGFDLGAQRRPINFNDLPISLSIIQDYKGSIILSNNFDIANPSIQIIDKEKIIINGFILSSERYKLSEKVLSSFPLIQLGEIAEFVRGPFGSSIKKSICVKKGINTYKVYEQGNVINKDFLRGIYYLTHEKFKELERFEIRTNDIVLTCAGTLGKVAIVPPNIEKGIINSVLMRIRVDEKKINRKYLVEILKSDYIQNKITNRSTGVTINNLFSTSQLKEFEIPLPLLSIQEEIVEEIEGYQKIIDGAKQVVENYKPRIDIDPEWEMVELGEVCEIARGGSPRPINDYITDSPDGINWIKIGDVKEGEKYIYTTKEKIKPEGIKKTRLVKEGDFILSNSMSFGRPYILKTSGAIHDGWLLIRIKDDTLLQDFLYYILGSSHTQSQFKQSATGGVVLNLNSDLVRKVKIPLPSTEIQRRIVGEKEQEHDLVESNKKLIEIFEQRIKDRIKKVYGE